MINDFLIVIPYSTLNNPDLDEDIKKELEEKLKDSKCLIDTHDELFKLRKTNVEQFDVNDIIDDEAYYIVNPNMTLSDKTREYLNGEIIKLEKTDKNNYYTEYISKRKSFS